MATAKKKAEKKSTSIERMTTKKVNPVREYAALPQFYANNTSVTTRLYDMQFIFSHVVTESDEEIVIDPQLVLRMSLPHAKAICNILQKQIKQYEEKNGPIPTSSLNAPTEP